MSYPKLIPALPINEGKTISSSLNYSEAISAIPHPEDHRQKSHGISFGWGIHDCVSRKQWSEHHRTAALLLFWCWGSPWSWCWALRVQWLVVGVSYGWQVPESSTFFHEWAKPRTFGIGDKLGRLYACPLDDICSHTYQLVDAGHLLTFLCFLTHFSRTARAPTT